MIDLMQLPASDAERIAYAEGFTGTAELFGRIADAEALVDPDLEEKLRDELADMEAERDAEEARADELEVEVKMLRGALAELARQVREDIPDEQGSRHPWDAVEDAEQLI